MSSHWLSDVIHVRQDHLRLPKPPANHGVTNCTMRHLLSANGGKFRREFYCTFVTSPTALESRAAVFGLIVMW